MWEEKNLNVNVCHAHWVISKYWIFCSCCLLQRTGRKEIIHDNKCSIDYTIQCILFLSFLDNFIYFLHQIKLSQYSVSYHKLSSALYISSSKLINFENMDNIATCSDRIATHREFEFYMVRKSSENKQINKQTKGQTSGKKQTFSYLYFQWLNVHKFVIQNWHFS